MWYYCQWDNYPQKTKMTQTLTTISHRMLLNFNWNSIKQKIVLLSDLYVIRICTRTHNLVQIKYWNVNIYMYFFFFKYRNNCYMSLQRCCLHFTIYQKNLIVSLIWHNFLEIWVINYAFQLGYLTILIWASLVRLI